MTRLALTFTFVAWAGEQSREALQWLNGIPAQEQEKMLDGYALGLAPEAWKKVLSTADAGQRTRLLSSIAHAWDAWGRTADTIEEAARSSGLPPHEAALLKRLVDEKQQ